MTQLEIATMKAIQSMAVSLQRIADAMEKENPHE